MASGSCRNGRGSLALAITLGALLALPAVARGQGAPGGSVSDAKGGGPKLPFRGSTFNLDQSTTPETLGPSAQLSRLPSYQWWLSLRPRWYLTDTLSFRLRIDMTTEWLNAVDTTRKREPLWGDLWTELVYSGVPEVLGIKSSVGLRALWPSSLTSQMRGYYTQLGLTLALSRTFKTRIGAFGLDVLLAGTHPFAKSTSGGFLANDGSYDCVYGDFRGALCQQMGGPMNPYFNLTAAMSARYAPIDALSFNFAYVMVDSWLYNTPDVTISDATGGTTVVERSATDQRFRQAGWFSASIDYDATSWLSLGLGYYVFRSILNPDSTVGNPFWSPGGNSRLYFSMTFGLDQVYQSIHDRVKKSRQPALETAKVAAAAPASR